MAGALVPQAGFGGPRKPAGGRLSRRFPLAGAARAAMRRSANRPAVAWCRRP